MTNPLNMPGPNHGSVLFPELTDHDLGRLITSRRGSLVGWVVAFLALGIGILLGWAAIATNSPRDRQIAIVLAIASATLVVTFVLLVRSLIRTFEFREFGVLVRRGTKVLQTMRYDACTRFRYELTRHYVNGFYSGTTLVITLYDAAKKRIHWSGRHKEKPQGFAFIGIGRTFKGEDELDVVKLVISEAVADRWVDRMIAGESLTWGSMSLGQTHAIPKKGKYKHQSIPYAQIDRFAADRGWMHLFRVGDEKSFFNMLMNAENFWPGMLVLERIWAANAADVQGTDPDPSVSSSVSL